ncbi:MAG: TonB-dependent receptor [Flavobacteriales bacterium]
MKSLLLILAGVFVHCNALLAQQLRGTVTDLGSKEPLISVYVSVDSMYSTTTDIDGFYTINLPSGKHSVSFAFIGYNSKIVEVELTTGQIKSLDISLEEASTSLDVAVVSAGKFEQKIEEVTVSMEVIQPNVIENKNTTSIEDVLQQAPGVVIVDSEPQIRSGSGFSFGAGSRVMVMVDDMPLLSGDAGRPSWGFFAVENVEQIEIIKGASSVLYGSGALNGVMNVRTAYPRSEPKTKVVLFHGFYSKPRTSEARYWDRTPLISGANFLHSRQIGNLDVVVGASLLVDESFKGPYLDSTSNYSPFDPKYADATSRARANVNLRYRSKKIKGLDYGVNTNWLIGSSISTLLWANDTTGLYAPYNNSATRTDQIVGNVDPFINYVTPKGRKHSLKTRWFNLDNNNDTRSAENPEGNANQDNFSDFYYSEYQFQTDLDSLGIQNLKLTAGVMSMFTFSEAQLYAGENTDGNNTARNIATYLQLDKKLGERLNLSGGVRLENFRINNQEETKPVFRSGLSYKVFKGTFLRASYGQGFRFPTMAEKFITTAVGGVNIFPSLDLQPETSENIEVGLKQGFKLGKFLGYLDVSAFEQNYSNFIEFTFGRWSSQGELTEQIGFKSLNTGEARVRGAEVTALGKGKIRKIGLQLLAGYTYTLPTSLTPDLEYGGSETDAFISTPSYSTSSSDTTDQILKYRFRHLIRADIEANYNKFSLGVSARYNSRVENIDFAFIDLDDIGVLPTGVSRWMRERNNGDTVIDLRVAYRISEHLKASVVINNLLNREYALRPLAIESPRLTTFQLALDL